MKDLDDQVRKRWRQERRRVYRTYHPDMGGDQETLERKLLEVDRRFGQVPRHRDDRIYVFSTAGPLAVLRGALALAARVVQQRFQRRTYFDLKK